MEVADLVVRLRADASDLKRGFGEAEHAGANLKSSFSGLSAALAGLGMTSAIGAVAKLGIQFLSLKEQAHIAFTTMLGSGQAASAFLKDLADFAARTPFEFPELIQSAQRLKAMGFEASQVIPTLTAVGDAVAAMGGNAEMINRITVAFTQMVAKGKVSAEEMRQLAEAGIPAWQILADKLGITVPEAMKKAEKGMIDGRTAVNFLIEGIEKGTKHTQAFEGMMDKQSRTAKGLFSTLKDLGRQALGDILLPAFEKMRDLLAKIVEVLPKAVEWFQALSSDTKNTILAFTAVLAVAPLLVGAITLIAGAISAMLSPIGLVVIALGALAVAYAGNLGGIRDSINEFAVAAADLWRSLNLFLKADAKDTWGDIATTVSDSVSLISRLIKSASAELRGDWGNAWRGIVDVCIDALTTVGHFIAKWVENLPLIGNQIRDWINFQSGAAKASIGIKGPTLDFIAPSTVPGLPPASVMNEADAALRSLGRTMATTGGHAKAMGKAMKEDLAGAFQLVQDWLRQSGQTVEATKSVFDKLPKSIRDSLIKSANEFHENSMSVQRWGLILAGTFAGTGLEVSKLANGFAINSSKIEASFADLGSKIKENFTIGTDAMMEFGAAHADMSFKAQKANTAATDAIEADWKAVSDTFKDLSAQLPRAWNTIIDGILQGSGRVGADLLKLGVKVKGFANDILNVFDTLPGKWGSAFQKTIGEIERWVNFIDNAIKLIQRLLGSTQSGLGGLFDSFSQAATKASDVFASTWDTINNSATTGAGEINRAVGSASAGLSDLSEQLSQSGDQAKQTAAKWVAAVAGVVAGIGMFIGSRHQGLATGILGGAMGGFTAGAAIGSVIPGLGTLIGGGIGAAIGAIAGIFGSGRNQEEQKKAEAAAALSAEQTGRAIVGAYLDNMTKALDFLSKVNEFENISKEKFRSFMKWFGKLLSGFVETMKVFGNTNAAKAKEIAEAIGPIINAIAAAPAAFNAINAHFGVAQSSIDRFFVSFDKVMNAFFARADVWIDGQSKRAMKVANRLSPVVELISGFAGSVTSIAEIKEPTDEMFSIFDRVIEKIVTHVEALSGKFDKSVLKVMANFAEKAGSALALWKDAIDAIKSTVDIKQVADVDVDNIVGGIEMFIGKLGESLERLATTDLTRIAAFASTILPISAALKSWAETTVVIRGYTVIAAESWDAIVTDFGKALKLMAILIDQATLFESMAITLEDKLKSGAAHLASGIAAMTGAVMGTAAVLQSAFGHIQGGVPVTGAMTTTAFSGASSIIGGNMPASGPGGSGVVFMPGSIVVQGSLIHQSQLENVLAAALERRRRAGGVTPLWA